MEMELDSEIEQTVDRLFWKSSCNCLKRIFLIRNGLFHDIKFALIHQTELKQTSSNIN